VPKTIRIYSRNATFQHFETLLRNREKRQRHREFVVEGVRPINLALQHGWPIRGWLYTPQRERSQWARDLLAKHPAPTHYELAEPLLEELSEKNEPSEILALIGMPDEDLSRIPRTRDWLVVIFDRPANPGNLGTVIRSCDALGAHGLVITGHAVDLYDPETIRASVGTLFALPVIRVAAPRELEPWFEQVHAEIGHFQIVGTSAKAPITLHEMDWQPPTVLVLGNETSGLSAHYRQRCDALVTIPQYGTATSLNVASAASILLYEINRQRRAAQPS
jgi:tRNA G18 (ribose-2'-O)-methylase SpoU